MRHKTVKRVLLAALVLTSGSLFASSCLETFLMAFNPCGTIFAFCTEQDWLRIIDPVITAPNYDVDPSCTIPFRCDPPYPPPIT